MSEHDSIHVGQVIASQFNILKKLGAGGMGAVFLAEQLGMDRHVVVKVMHPELTAGSPQAVERFKREAKAVAQLNHPNIVQVYVFGQTPTGQMYLAMEYIEGRDLTAELQRGPMDQIRALKILDQVLSALVEAHAAGIVHRDLKPDNIMLADRHGNADYVKVLDFGIAKMADPAAATLTQAGAVFGTPRYMAPEQAKGGKVDARADLYALGVMLYEMLTGVHPFRSATTALEYIVKHATEDIHAPSVDFTNLAISPRIEALLARCVAKDPDARYPSARELQRELRLCLRDFPEAARGFPTDGTAASPPSRPSTRPAASAPRKGTPLWVWGAVAVLVAAGIAAGVYFATQAPPTADPVVALTASPPPETVRPPAPTPPTDPPPTTPPAERPEPSTPAPTTDLAEGMPIDGFPVPARARITTSTAQAEILETDLTAREVLTFFKAKLAGRYGALTDIPNGLMIGGDEAPFSTLSVMTMGDRLNIVLARNAMAKAATAPPSLEGKRFFDVPAIPDASIVMKSPQVAVLRSRASMVEACRFYTEQLAALDGVTTVQDAAADTPYCNFAASAEAKTAWQGVAIVVDPTSKGALMISIQARP